MLPSFYENAVNGHMDIRYTIISKGIPSTELTELIYVQFSWERRSISMGHSKRIPMSFILFIRHSPTRIYNATEKNSTAWTREREEMVNGMRRTFNSLAFDYRATTLLPHQKKVKQIKLRKCAEASTRLQASAVNMRTQQTINLGCS